MEECDRYLDSKEDMTEVNANTNGGADQAEMTPLPTSPDAAPMPQRHLYPGPPPGFRAFLQNDHSGLGLFYPRRPARQLTLDDISAEFLDDDFSQSHIRAFRSMYEDALLEMQMTPSNLQRFMDVYVQQLRDFLVKRRVFPIEAEHEWRRKQERMQQRIRQWTKENVDWMMQHGHLQVKVQTLVVPGN